MKLGFIGWLIGVFSIVLVALFFSSIWPLVSVDLGRPKSHYIGVGRDLAREQVPDIDSFTGFVSLAVRSEEADALQEEFSQEQVQTWTEEPNGLVRYYVRFRKDQDPRAFVVTVSVDGELIGFKETLTPESVTGEQVTEQEARDLIERSLLESYGIDFKGEAPRSSVITQQFGKQVTEATYARPFKTSAIIEERFFARVVDGRVMEVARRVSLTDDAEFQRSKTRGPEQGMDRLGYLLMGIGLLVAYIVFIFQLRRGNLELKPSLLVGALLFFMVFASALLDRNYQFEAWNPLWPRLTMWIRMTSSQFFSAIWALLLGWTLLAAGSGVPGTGKEKTETFWRFMRLRWGDRDIALASIRGVAIGFFCGAVLIGIVKLLAITSGGEVGLQPRGFYLTMLDRQWPALALLLFFFPIAVIEEAGYRLFGGLWIDRSTKLRWLAIAVPAIIFGLVHTTLGFLPPESPWWGRAVVMIAVGIVWGWAFFKFDYLTVVLSHLMADLVIFAWPLLFSEYWGSRITAWVVASVALWPALIWGLTRLSPKAKKINH
ncbi:MAG: lysostaphin resistance A-like protein [Verrucomicrobiota bacterium]